MDAEGANPGVDGVEGVVMGVFDPELLAEVGTIQMRSNVSGNCTFDFDNLLFTRFCNSFSVSTKPLSSNTCSATMVSELITILNVVATDVPWRCPIVEVGVVGEGGRTGNMLVPGTVRLALRVEFFKIPTGCFEDVEGE